MIPCNDGYSQIQHEIYEPILCVCLLLGARTNLAVRIATVCLSQGCFSYPRGIDPPPTTPMSILAKEFMKYSCHGR